MSTVKYFLRTMGNSMDNVSRSANTGEELDNMVSKHQQRKNKASADAQQRASSNDASSTTQTIASQSSVASKDSLILIQLKNDKRGIFHVYKFLDVVSLLKCTRYAVQNICLTRVNNNNNNNIVYFLCLLLFRVCTLFKQVEEQYRQELWRHVYSSIIVCDVHYLPDPSCNLSTFSLTLLKEPERQRMVQRACESRSFWRDYCIKFCTLFLLI